MPYFVASLRKTARSPSYFWCVNNHNHQQEDSMTEVLCGIDSEGRTTYTEGDYKYVFFGDLVAVRCRLLTSKTEILVDSAGNKHTVPVRSSELDPSSEKKVVFACLRRYSDGTAGLDEECSVEGGHTAQQAEALAKDILEAVAFIRSVC